MSFHANPKKFLAGTTLTIHGTCVIMKRLASEVKGRTMATMSKKKRKPPNYRHPRVALHIPQDLLDVIEASAQQIGRTRTTEVVRRLKEAYQAAGLWPSSSGGKP
jgi:hypothetical protein